MQVEILHCQNTFHTFQLLFSIYFKFHISLFQYYTHTHTHTHARAREREEEYKILSLSFFLVFFVFLIIYFFIYIIFDNSHTGRKFLLADFIINGNNVGIGTVHLESFKTPEIREAQLKNIADVLEGYVLIHLFLSFYCILSY